MTIYKLKRKIQHSNFYMVKLITFIKSHKLYSLDK